MTGPETGGRGVSATIRRTEDAPAPPWWHELGRAVVALGALLVWAVVASVLGVGILPAVRDQVIASALAWWR